MACEPYAGLMRRRREGLVGHGGLRVDGVPMKSGTPTLPEKESDAIECPRVSGDTGRALVVMTAETREFAIVVLCYRYQTGSRATNE